MERQCCLIRRKHFAFCDYFIRYEFDVTLYGLSIALSDIIVTLCEFAITFVHLSIRYASLLFTYAGLILLYLICSLRFDDFLIPSVDISFRYVTMAG